jgi:hypothetical protein
MPRTSRSLGKYHIHLHHPLEVCRDKLASMLLVMVELLQPLDPLLDQNFTRLGEINM